MSERRGIGRKQLARMSGTIPGPLITYHQLTASGTATYTFPPSTQGVYIVDVFCVNSGAGGAADTITVQKLSGSTTTDISDAMDINKSDKVVTRAGTLDVAAQSLKKNEIIKITTASGAVADVYILAVNV